MKTCPVECVCMAHKRVIAPCSEILLPCTSRSHDLIYHHHYPQKKTPAARDVLKRITILQALHNHSLSIKGLPPFIPTLNNTVVSDLGAL